MNFFKCATICLGLSFLAASAYIVKEGDTLWDLSDEFLQDPFAWPDLWENNRHIQDPHWIYPGDSIYFGDTISADEQATSPSEKKQVQKVPYNPYPCASAMPDSNLPKGIEAVGCDERDTRKGNFETMLGDLRKRDKKQKKVIANDSYFYTQRPMPKIFNGYYQTLAPEVYMIDSLKKDSRFFSIKSGELKEPIVHIPENEVVVGIGRKSNANLKEGDIVEIFDAKVIEIPEVKGYGFEEIALLQLTGYAKITAIGDTLSRASIVQSFNSIKISQSKARLKGELSTINVSGYTPVKEAAINDMARIRYAIDPNLVISTYSYILIDKGQKQDYNSGDAVAIWKPDNSDASIAPRLLGRGIIVRSDVDNSVVLIRELFSKGHPVELGQRVSITHKAKIVQ